MKSKPDIAAFLDGATTPKPSAPPAARLSKTIRIPADLNDALRDRAYQLSREQGRRVAESDIIEEALRKYLNT